MLRTAISQSEVFEGTFNTTKSTIHPVTDPATDSAVTTLNGHYFGQRVIRTVQDTQSVKSEMFVVV